MSLATRCPACHTTFRVVQDQLKVSEGWVRCGRCNEVFNAIEGLFDLDRDGAPTPPGVITPELRKPDASSHPQPAPPVPPPPAPAPPPLPTFVAFEPPQAGPFTPVPAPSPRPEEAAPTAYEVLDSRFLDRSTYGPEQKPEFDDGFADARYDSTLEGHELESQAVAAGAPVWQPRAADTRKRSRKGAPRRKDEDRSGPEFLRQAERQERWQSPGVRLALLASVLLFAVVLTLQAALHWRDTIAAHRPALRPLLSGLCKVAGCRVGPLRRIDDVLVDSSSLARGNGVDSYRLTVLVRNRGAVPLALPHIDLSLTDGSGELVARRALSPADFNAADTIAARSEVSLTLDLTTPGHRVTGFTVEAFYP
ncbi:zinc-ribbon domain-containing protein [Aquabacterium sp. A7-Y]|uniref:zinc-ribbon and DUF3426 domain-containing protein n=1 Tax=Aquabacterium sp. A7-Y TaxID=1349605 RepID=UPI00223CA5FF|nr:zinc-ribbon and DUF3426 domain-containing protein [Aquabacterium sp. A7-Y]MCW7537459.1 zinc-ribbon domain-containing protein [Aquabacterium sp. A7-Y]